MSNQNTYEKLNKLMASYVPEFSYDSSSDEPGSVLTTICADMMDDSVKRFQKVVPKHKIQYLNMLDFLKKEPVAAAKGYVQFQPVLGFNERNIMVPKHTKVLCNDTGDYSIVFETKNDICATSAVPTAVIVTDRASDTIVKKDMNGLTEPWKAFDISGKNESVHKLYLCFDYLFDYLQELDFDLKIEMETGENNTLITEIMKVLLQPNISFSILNALGEEVKFDSVERKEKSLHFIKKEYVPEKAVVLQREGYYLVVSAVDELPEIYLDNITITLQNEKLLPEEVMLNSISEPIGMLYPFGKPMGLYHEMSMENKEVFSKKGAKIKLEFDLDYVKHEESIEIIEVDLEYKNIMKKPQKTAAVKPVEVLADYVIWEYLSISGWKRIWKEEYIASLFNGTASGHIKLEFTCPDDIAPYLKENLTGRIRARLIKCDNVYKMPAVYICPRIMGLQLSYQYEEHKYPDYSFTKNGFDYVDVTSALKTSEIVRPFYNLEHEKRCMYLSFSSSLAGSPTSIYFDIENYSDKPVNFGLEYLTNNGFKAIKSIDHTAGFLGPGNLLMLIPQDMASKKMYGTEGYFLRFVNYNTQNPEHTLPIINGIYMNMVKVENVNTREDFYYIDNKDADLDIQLSQTNLLNLEVSVKERDGETGRWVKYHHSQSRFDIKNSYEEDLAAGKIHFSKNIISNIDLAENGPHIKVKHSNYAGSIANVGKNQITVLQNSISYISSVTNPFPTYGGYDGYTEQTSQQLISAMLRTRNRAVTSQDYFDLIYQTTFGVRKVKCVSGVDLFGNRNPAIVTVAVLIDEYEKGVHIFSEMRDSIRQKLQETSGLVPIGKEIVLTQPHFVKLNVRVWLERETMDGVYDIQNKALEVIRDFIDPLTGGSMGEGPEIGEFPRATQIITSLRNAILDCNISKIVLTATIDGKEIPVSEDFYQKYSSPFIMAVNGEHMVYIELQ